MVGAVFVMTNAWRDPIRGVGNEVVMYRRRADGTLLFPPHGYFPTGGRGSGPGFVPNLQADPLGSQGGLILSHDNRLLFAVNAGSDEVSVFRVDSFGLLRVAKVPSGGMFPTSLTLHGGLLYVLNAGGEGNITGFRVQHSGELTPLPGSTRSLGAGGDNPPFVLASPAQVGFSPEGDQLLVTVKQLRGPGVIHVFAVDEDGMPSLTPVSNQGTGELPFGFTFDRQGRLLVTEVLGAPQTPGDPTGASAVSSYRLRANGTLGVRSDSVGNGQTAMCWIVAVGRFAYVSNTGSNTLTGYHIGPMATLSLLDADGVSATTNGTPLDVGVSRDGRFLYVLQPASGTVGAWAIDATTGQLSPLGDVEGLERTPDEAPLGPFMEGGAASGLAAF